MGPLFFFNSAIGKAFYNYATLCVTSGRPTYILFRSGITLG